MYFTYTGIRVRNLQRSLRFYTKVMGMREILRGRMKHGGIFVHLKSPRSAQRLELNYYPSRTKFYEPYRFGSELDHLAFWVKDVGKEYARLVAKGARGTIQPFREGRYELAFIKDPDQAWIELIGLAKHSNSQS
jgi:lactoylglutathione lyase